MSTQTSLSDQAISAIRTVIGSGPAVLHEPSFNGNEWLYLKECLESTFVSAVGKFVDRFEADLAAFWCKICGCRGQWYSSSVHRLS